MQVRSQQSWCGDHHGDVERDVHRARQVQAGHVVYGMLCYLVVCKLYVGCRMCSMGLDRLSMGRVGCLKCCRFSTGVFYRLLQVSIRVCKWSLGVCMVSKGCA